MEALVSMCTSTPKKKKVSKRTPKVSKQSSKRIKKTSVKQLKSNDLAWIGLLSDKDSQIVVDFAIPERIPDIPQHASSMADPTVTNLHSLQLTMNEDFPYDNLSIATEPIYEEMSHNPQPPFLNLSLAGLHFLIASTLMYFYAMKMELIKTSKLDTTFREDSFEKIFQNVTCYRYNFLTLSTLREVLGDHPNLSSTLNFLPKISFQSNIDSHVPDTFSLNFEGKEYFVSEEHVADKQARQSAYTVLSEIEKSF
jgi:hypothetical protein